MNEDIYLCGCYVWCENSPAYNVISVDFFELLENDISIYENKGRVLLCGDFNSRIGSKPDFVIHDVLNSFIDDIDYDPDTYSGRVSVDRSHNNHGI